MVDVGHLERLGAAILPGTETGNAVVSPFNVAAALQLLVPGARGVTAAELERLLGSDPVESARSMTYRLEALDGTEAVGPTAAWISPVLDMKSDYARAIEKELTATLATLDFSDPGRAAATINRWVAKQTRERIADLVSPGDLDPFLTRLVLTAALYFKAAWMDPLTRIGPRPFEVADGRRAEREFMAKSERLEYAEAPGWQAVRIPYSDRFTSLEIVLPADLAAFEGDLAANLEQVRAALTRVEVVLELPLFNVRRRAELKPALEAAGLGSAFSEAEADLSGITDAEKLFVSAVIHEALIEVDEKGTLAAAATAAVIRATSARVPSEPKRMVVDRPFVFVLRGPESVPLFVGRVTDPG